MARIMTFEMKTIGSAVKTKPNIVFHDKNLPVNLTTAFPDAAKVVASNGMISFSKYINNFLIIFYRIKQVKSS